MELAQNVLGRLASYGGLRKNRVDFAGWIPEQDGHEIFFEG
jgi:hypothetical protein